MHPSFSLFYVVLRSKVVSAKLDNGVSSVYIYINKVTNLFFNLT